MSVRHAKYYTEEKSVTNIILFEIGMGFPWPDLYYSVKSGSVERHFYRRRTGRDVTGFGRPNIWHESMLKMYVEKFIQDLLRAMLPAWSNSQDGSSSNHTETHYLTQFLGVGHSTNVIG